MVRCLPNIPSTFRPRRPNGPRGALRPFPHGIGRFAHGYASQNLLNQGPLRELFFRKDTCGLRGNYRGQILAFQFNSNPDL